MSAIAANCDVPVSVKCRIGVDDHDSYNELCECLHQSCTIICYLELDVDPKVIYMTLTFGRKLKWCQINRMLSIL